MARTARLDVPLSLAQRAELDAVAAATGLKPTALGRLGIIQICSKRDLLLTGVPPAGGTGGALDGFLHELRADLCLSASADQLEAAFSALDTEADGNSSAAGLHLALLAISRTRQPVVDRLRAMSELLQIDGLVRISIPRVLVEEAKP